MGSNNIDFQLNDDFIALIQLLKATQVAQTGGHAKMLVDDNCVKLNGNVENRRRAKIRRGDKIELEGATINVK